MNKTVLFLIAVALPVSATADDAKHDMDHQGGTSINHAEMHHDQGSQHYHDADRHDLAMKAATITHTEEISAALADGGAPVVVDVLGVVCDFCATAMNKVFSKRNEVAAIYVDLDKKTLSLVINDGSDLSDKQIERLAKQAGYRIAAIRRDSEAMGG